MQGPYQLEKSRGIADIAAKDRDTSEDKDAKETKTATIRWAQPNLFLPIDPPYGK